MEKFQCILFDLDGTLTESGPGIIHSMNYALKQMGIQETERLKEFIGPPLNMTLSRLYHMNEEEIKQTIRLYRQWFDEHEIFNFEVYPGILEILMECEQRGIVCAVASSKPEYYVRRMLEHAGIDSYFRLICGTAMSDETTKGNRDNKQEVIRTVLTTFRGQQTIDDKTSVVMVGDKKNDVDGAAVNQIPCIGVGYGYGSKEELGQAQYYVKTTQELYALLFNQQA